MKNCPRCNAPIREGADFCTSCGASADGSQQTNDRTSSAQTGGRELVPLIVLAPQNSFASKRKLAQMGKMLGIVALIVVLALGAVFITSMVSTNVSVSNNFAQSDISNEKYTQCIALVQDVRNDNLDEIMSDLLKSEGVAENYYFFSAYEDAFAQILGEEYTATEEKFSQCCMMVAFTEFTAKKYKYYSESMLFGSTLSESVDTFRIHADTLWEMLSTAESETQLQQIIDYCAENKIITLK